MDIAYLDLYRNISPNVKGGIYYTCQDHAVFYSKILSKHKLGSTITPSSYRYVNGSFIIEGTAISMVNFRKATYATLRYPNSEEPDYPVFYFFHVVSVDYRSNKIIVNVVPDDFENGIQAAEFSNIHVTRTSRGSIDAYSVNPVLIYDGSLLNQGKTNFTETMNDYSDVYSLVAIAKIDSVVAADLFANNDVTRTAFVACSMDDIYAKFNEAKGTNVYDGLTMAQDFLGGVYEAMSLSPDPQSFKARCSGIYIVPQAWIKPLAMTEITEDGNHDYTLKIKSALSGYAGNLYGKVLPACNYEVEQWQNYGSDAYSTKYYLGTRGQTMDCPRSFVPYSTILNFSCCSTGISVKLRQGSSEIDITNAFVLPYSFSNAIDDETTQVQKGIVSGIGVFSNILKGASKGQGLGTGLKVYTDLASLMNNNNVTANSTDGNAFMTYIPEWQDGETKDQYIARCHQYYRSPLMQISVSDMNDGTAYIIGNGVLTDQWFADWEFMRTIQKRDFLGDASRDPGDTYVQADLCVTNVPENERKAIEDAFKQGIRYYYDLP